ncbi:MAG: anhydro-N-acetylmuramic acid kinase [Saprospiraceae bacterium]
MKQHVEQLAALVRKPARTIIGLMSGTSLDGLDVALCTVEGSGFLTKIRVEHFATVPYDADFRKDVRRVFAQPSIDFQHLVLLNVVVAERHAAIVNDLLAQWSVSPQAVDLIASHGQTVFHAPRQFHGLPAYPNATLQIGDGDHIARRTGITTVSDFRQKHLAAGGEGAPLALYGDYFLFSQPGEDRFLLNLGGIANFTFLPGDSDPAKVFATDTGPGNTLLDAAARRFFDLPCDTDGHLARQGRVDADLLARLKNHPYFARPYPSSTGPEQFGLDWVLEQTRSTATSPHDLLATLAHLTADTVADGIRRVQPTAEKRAVFLSGGGAHNPLLVESLRENLPGCTLTGMEALGFSGDAKEAVLFAVLANETVAGQTPPEARLGGLPLVGMGKISFPG